MPLAHEKTWNFDVNNAVLATGTVLGDNQAMLYQIKEALKALGANPWTVDYSCNSTTAGTAGDAVDRWTSSASLIWSAAGARSWIVLNIPNGSGGQFLFHCNNASAAMLERVWSPGGLFTGGTTTARPTATDEQILGTSSQNWASSHGTSQNHVWHVMHSDDGKQTHIVINNNNLANQLMTFATLEDPVTGLTNPYIVSMDDTTGLTDWPVTANLFDSQTFVSGVKNDNTQWKGALTSEHFLSALLGETINQNDFSGEYHLTPIRVASNGTGSKGSHGRIPDMYHAATSLATGDTFTEGGVKLFALFGEIALPFPDLTPVTA